MFDDDTKPQGTLPPNLPVDEPEDMLATVDTDPLAVEPVNPPASPSPSTPPAPPAQESVSALQAGALRPVTPATVPPTVPSPPPATPSRSEAPLPNAASPLPPPQLPDPLAEQTSPPSTSPPSSGPEDLFAGTLPSTPPASPFPTAQSPLPPADLPPVHTPPSGTTESTVARPGMANAIMTVVIVILFIVVIGLVGYFVYSRFFASSEVSQVPENTSDPFGETPALPASTTNDSGAANPSTATNGTSATNTNAQAVIDDAVLFGEPIDEDRDNLDTARELRLGTSPTDWDSDDDGLSDGDEVIVWNTDPLNDDTDGDGFKDGEEVRNGYRPDGPGRIFEPPTSEQTDTTTSTAVSTDAVMFATTADGEYLCDTDYVCFTAAAATCAPALFTYSSRYDLTDEYGVIQEITYEMQINGENSEGLCTVDTTLSRIVDTFADSVSESDQETQGAASRRREGQTMSCTLLGEDLVAVFNNRARADVFSTMIEQGSCVGPLSERA